jgi:hypothetical protein
MCRRVGRPLLLAGGASLWRRVMPQGRPARAPSMPWHGPLAAARAWQLGLGQGAAASVQPAAAMHMQRLLQARLHLKTQWCRTVVDGQHHRLLGTATPEHLPRLIRAGGWWPFDSACRQSQSTCGSCPCYVAGVPCGLICYCMPHTQHLLHTPSKVMDVVCAAPLTIMLPVQAAGAGHLLAPAAGQRSSSAAEPG